NKGKSRVLYLPPEAVALLREQRERYPHGTLLRNRCGKPWTGWAIVKAMQATRERAGLPGKVAYGLRHSFATDALANGVPDAQVAELLGHSGTAMLHRHYAHLTAKARVLRDALDRVRGKGNIETTDCTPAGSSPGTKKIHEQAGFPMTPSYPFSL